MTADDARALILRNLAEVAPEADLASLPADADLRTVLDLDSMDMFNLVTAISEESGVEIPDRDVGRLTSLDAAVGYLVGAPSAGA